MAASLGRGVLVVLGMVDEASVFAAARAIYEARGVLVGAGAGMGVDSGLPDFRGTEGFWRAYPPYQRLGVRFEEMADPVHFQREPAFAWGFYGHRRNLYRATVPHEGFQILRRLSSGMEGGLFAFTSNVDGQFQRAGFSDAVIVECHGAIEYEQCSQGCGAGVWEAEPTSSFRVDEATMRAEGPLPRCRRCDEIARPNILMFGDWGWDSRRTVGQERRYARWREALSPDQVVVIEIGAGTAIPTVRSVSERWQAAGATLVRINPREFTVAAGGISLRGGALEVLRRIEARHDAL